jgi:hypothetical protein
MQDSGEYISTEAIRAEPVFGRRPLHPLADVLLYGHAVRSDRLREESGCYEEQKHSQAEHGGLALFQPSPDFLDFSLPFKLNRIAHASNPYLEYFALMRGSTAA